jgi:hypothetical protein
MRFTKIRHREYLKHCNIVDTWRLAQEGKIPSVIEGFMLVTSLKHGLRVIYGTNLKAALALLGMALWDKFKYPFAYLNWLWHRKEWEAEEEREELQDIVSEFTEKR